MLQNMGMRMQKRFGYLNILRKLKSINWTAQLINWPQISEDFKIAGKKDLT